MSVTFEVDPSFYVCAIHTSVENLPVHRYNGNIATHCEKKERLQ